MLRLSLIAAACGWLMTTASAQEAARFTGEPIVVLRSAGWSEAATEKYFQSIRDDLQVGDRALEQLRIEREKPEAGNARTSLDAPVSGMLVYMVQGLVPDAQQVQFSEVADEAEFTRIVNARKQAAGELASLEGSGDRLKTTITNTWREDVTASQTDVAASEAGDETPAAPVNQVSISIGVDSSTGPVVRAQRVEDGELIHENGHVYREHSATTVSYYRYHDGLMFESATDGLWEASLPSSASLTSDRDSLANGEVRFFPDRIPAGFKHLGWNTLNAAAAVELQQRDDEPDDEYEVRRVPTDAGLALIRAAIFDTEEIAAWMRFAADEQPLHGEFRINARSNSALGKALDEFSSANSRFAPILNDGSAVTVHLAANLNEDWRNAIKVLAASQAHSLEMGAGTSPDDQKLLDTTRTVLDSLDSIAEHGTAELLLKLGWTQESGAVIYGGLQVDNADGLHDAMVQLVTLAVEGEYEVHVTDSADVKVIEIELAEDYFGDVELKLTRLCLAHANSCVWFAVGGDNSASILRQSITKCQELSGRSTTPILSATVDLQRWLSYPLDDPTGLNRLPELISSTMSYTMTEMVGSGSDPTGELNRDLLLRALSKGGGQELTLVASADSSGLVITGSAGTAITRALVAHLLSATDRMIPDEVEAE